MKEIRVKGTYENMGKQFGKTLSQWHRQYKPSEKHLEFAWACEHAVNEHAPDLLQELRGIEEVTGTSYEALIATNLASAWMFGCTLFAVKGEHTANGSPVFVRQMDWLKEDIDALHVIHAEPKGRHKSIGTSFGDMGRYGGQNEVGLTVGSAMIANYTGTFKPGVRMNISTRWILDNFSTTKEAIDYLTKIPHTEAMTFLIADKSGTIATVEAAPEKTAVAYCENGLEIATNFYKLKEMQDLDNGFPEDNFVYDYCRRIENWFEVNKGSISLDTVKAICSNPEKGICQASNKSTSVTIWSWITETNPAAFEIAPGPPCDTEYIKFEY